MTPMPNMALNLAPFGRWTLRDKAAQLRLALRWAALMGGRAMRKAAEETAGWASSSCLGHGTKCSRCKAVLRSRSALLVGRRQSRVYAHLRPVQA
jgi:hypothetical protein